MSLKRILFVDDEVHVLDGLRDLLRRQRHSWDMVFALGGQAALAEIERASFDVIVSDMRMPGMDGRALLQKVKEHHPRVVRIVLSGNAEPENILRTLPVAHQFLSKPCDVETLRTVIERACNLRALLENKAIRNVIGKLDKLPSAPRSYSELTKAITRPNVGPADIAAIVEQDPAMSIKVLQLVNSAYFGLAHRITSIQQAVLYIGIETIKGLALISHVFTTVATAHVDGFSLDRLQEHSLLTARLAKRMVTDRTLADEAFTAAIVHDIGEVVLALASPHEWAGVMRVAKERGVPLHEVEQDAYGTTHAEVGAYLLGMWGLPFSIVETAAYHHRPGTVPSDSRSVLAAVHIADAIADATFCPEGAGVARAGLDVGFLEGIGLHVDLPHWRALAMEEIHAIATHGQNKPPI